MASYSSSSGQSSPTTNTSSDNFQYSRRHNGRSRSHSPRPHRNDSHNYQSRSQSPYGSNSYTHNNYSRSRNSHHYGSNTHNSRSYPRNSNSDTSPSSGHGSDLGSDNFDLGVGWRHAQTITEEGRAQRQDPLSRGARHWTRTCDMWENFRTILSADQMPGATQQLRLKEQLCQLKEICPDLDRSLQTRSLNDVIAVMECARNNGRGEDIKRIKDNINRIFVFSPPLNHVKETRGFNNLQIGKLLLPPNLASEWDTDIALQQRYQQGLETPNAHNYGIWMYQNHSADPDNLLVGFLRSNALVRAFRIIFQGLSSVEGRGPSGRATKKGNAELNNMRKVTIPSIAYVATLVRFALDSAPTFAAGGNHGTFNYHAFYTSIVTLLMMGQMKDFRDSLLTWWNQQVFPYQEPEQIEYNDTVHAQMLAQLLVNNTNVACS